MSTYMTGYDVVLVDNTFQKRASLEEGLGHVQLQGVVDLMITMSPGHYI